jgi:hypothetical protein
LLLALPRHTPSKHTSTHACPLLQTATNSYTQQTHTHTPTKKQQDLELYLTKEEVEGGYTLVARYGRVLQELAVRTKLDRDTMKTALTRVLSRVR